MHVGEGRVEAMVVCVGVSVGVLMRFVQRSLGVGMGVFGDGCVGVGWVCVLDVGGWVSEFWTSGIVCILKLTMSTVCLTQLTKKWTAFVLEKH